MASDADNEQWADLVCPACYDFGFTRTSLRGVIAKSVDKTDSDLAAESQEKKRTPQEQDVGASRDTSEQISEIARKLRVADDVAPGLTSTPQVDTRAVVSPKDAKTSGDGNPLVISGPMQHKDDGRLETIYTVPLDLNTVEPLVSDILLGRRDPNSLSHEELGSAFPKAQLIKNMITPFNYWLSQPCPAHRNDAAEPPCVAIRRAVHEYLQETSPDYRGQIVELLGSFGYVEEGSHSLSLRIGHPDLGPENAKGESALQANSWPVSVFTKEDIPSPWRRPWYPDDGWVVCKRPQPSGDTASEETFEKATKWFQDCITSHEQCPASQTQGLLPDRVIDIGPPGSTGPLRLVSADGRRARYACLSHRWGPETPSMTTKNLDDFCRGIPWDSLSPTYQDSIAFLRRFSAWHEKNQGEPIRYLWIDSLCIIQDSGEDWTAQSQKMCDIYSDSYVTLVESYRHGGEKRLFSTMSPDHVPKTICVKDAEGNERQVYLRQEFMHPDFMVNNGEVPIWKRAWVLQERLLSPRLLIFGSEELSWQCSNCNKCECGIDEKHDEAYRRMLNWKEDKFAVRMPQASSRQKLDVILGKDPPPARLRMAWRLVLESYSRLDMTFRKDTLPAIAGLARSFNKQLGDIKYLAGMWYEEQVEGNPKAMTDSLLDLLWRLEYRKDARRENLTEPIVQTSFSWAHPQCSIIYPFVHDEILNQYSFVIWIQGAQNVPRLPDDHEAPRTWLRDMYTDSPSSCITMIGPIWKTRLAKSSRYIAIKNTEDREYCYHLGAMSDKIWEGRALGRPFEVPMIVVQPPNDEGNENQQQVFSTMPPICFYADNLLCVVEGPIYCFPLGTFKHLPVKQDLGEKTIFVALVLAAVGHSANREGTDPNLESKDPSDLVFRRLGLAYTTDGEWTEEHEEIVAKRGRTIVRII